MTDSHRFTERTFGRDITNIQQIRQSKSLTMTIKCQIDLRNPFDTLVKEIYSYCRQKDYSLDPVKIEKQNEINFKMRAILVDWLVDVHLRFRLLNETLFMTVHLIDSYLQKKQVPRSTLQLLGIAALFMACKYCEIYPPKLQLFSDVTDKTYSKQEILEMESKVLLELQFDLVRTSQVNYLERYTHLADFDDKSKSLGKYILELTLQDHHFIQYLPSIMAAATIYLIQKIYKKIPQPWTVILAQETQFSEAEIRPVAKEICQLLCSAPTMQLSAIQRKYDSLTNHQVARIQIQYK